ncbi:NAD-dependent epimerase/dehydratase family protein [Roseateles sp. LYH14W]|uniref:NAD-dependent epimerase/dehydratase family protein n=1 Tax=Pelomonas parva TaxID=3299032 RepID=A0ABW7F864_9BURK
MMRPARLSPLDLPAEDLQRCHDLLGPSAWQALAGRRVFVTGGTGFVGKWLLGTLIDADEVFGLDCRITVLSRDPTNFQHQWPAMAERVEWVAGDVRDFPIGSTRYDVIVHAATDVVAQATPHDVFTTCVDGTRRVMGLARACGATRLLLLSSGAVYGRMPAGMTHVPETYLGGPDPLLAASAYGEGKRASEWLAVHAGIDGLAVGVARLFAVVGPHLPLDKHFAIGNFLRSALDKTDIVIQGDGTPHRSYLYAADMAAWLWAILLRGDSGRAYNVGAQESISIRDLATTVFDMLDTDSRIRVLTPATAGREPERYVPDTRLARARLDLPAPLGLKDAILRTARWHQRPPPSQGIVP